MRFLIQLLCFVYVLLPFAGKSQVAELPILTFKQYIEMIKTNHPLVLAANLTPEIAQQDLRRAKGLFDPQAFTYYDAKEFKKTDYYRELSAGIKIPTLVGIDFKAGYDLAQGDYVNPETTTPQQGLIVAGVSVPLGQGLFIDSRREALRKAKIAVNASVTERNKLLNDLMLDASKAYWEWAIAVRQREFLQQIVALSEERFLGVKSSWENGSRAAIDTLEAFIQVQTLQFQLNSIQLEVMNATNNLSNFLWLDGEVPLRPNESTQPESPNVFISTLLDVEPKTETLLAEYLSTHPEILLYGFKLESIKVDQQMAREKLKPKLNLNYNMLSNGNTYTSYFNSLDPSNNYKFGLEFSYSLYLRAERSKLKATNFKLEQTGLQAIQKSLEIENKISNYVNEFQVQKSQVLLFRQTTENYRTLSNAENTKFRIGESSVFLMNSRENKLIEANYKLLETEYKFLKAYYGLLWSAGIIHQRIEF